MASIRTVLASALDLVLPRACMACDVLLASDETDWCRNCASALLAATSSEYCPRCGLNARPYLLDETGCSECRSAPTPLAGIARVGPYDSTVGLAIRRFKYNRRQQMDKALGRLLASAIARFPWAAEVDALVPIPTTRRNQWSYRFKPSELLATATGAVLGLPMLPIVSVRGKERDQVGLPMSQRIENVRGVFHASRHARLEGRTLCLIDDVSTSGATLREMGRTLVKAGAKNVYAAVLAKTDPKDYDR